MDIAQTISTKEIVLEKLRIVLEHRIAAELIDPEVEWLEDCILDSIIMRLRGYIWSERIDTIVFKRPSSWWQMLKEQKAPRWFLRWWPVQYVTKEIDVLATYPDFRPSLPDRQYRFVTRIIRDETT